MPQLILKPPPYLTGGTGRIEGVVQDVLTAKPIEGATVLIRPCPVQVGSVSHGPFHEWTPFFKTDSDGAFHIDGLPGGRFHIEASGDGYLSHQHSHLAELHDRPGKRLAFEVLWTHSHSSSWDEAWNEIGAAEPILRNQYPRLAEGETARIVVGLRPGHVISGRVLKSGGAPIADASIARVFQRVPVGRGMFEVNDLDSATSAADGAFQLAVFPEAGVELTVKAPGFAALHRTLPKSFEGPVDIVLAAAGSIRGRVVRSDGRVALRTRVAIFDPTDLETAVTADADETGAWSIENAPAPPFAVMAWHGYSGACWTVVREPAPELNLVIHPLKKVRGQVVEPDGSPVDGEYVRQVFPFEWNGKEVVIDTLRLDLGIMLEKTDADGRFRTYFAFGGGEKALLKYDYRSAPVPVDGVDELRLVVSEKTAQSRALQRKYAGLHRNQPDTESPAASPSCAVPKSPKPDLHPADFEDRNRTWIAELESKPPRERVALLEHLQEDIGGGG